jgi:hypothetical protein
MMTLEERFWSKVDKSGDCWIWTAAILSPAGTKYARTGGYGMFGVGSKVLRAHRVSYEMANGPVPPGLEIDHLCRNKKCVNPSHLEAVTHLENVRRYFRTITSCKWGHEYTPENTYIKPNGSRNCRECNRTRSREY